MIRRLSINKESKYRLYNREKGVVGPPHKDSDNVINLKIISENISVEWKTSGTQDVSGFDIDLQEFVEHVIDLDGLVKNKWLDLLNTTTLIRSNQPKFILLTGLPGSGKTTLGKNLSLRTGWLHFNFADFAHEVIGASPLMVNDYTKVGKYVEIQLNDAIKDGISVIYDTTSPTFTMRQHHMNAVRYTDSLHVIYLPTIPSICFERISSRNPAGPIDLRPEVYRSDLRHIRTFCDFVNEYEPPTDCILANNESDLDSILRPLERNR